MEINPTRTASLAWSFEMVGQDVDVIGRDDSAGTNYGGHKRAGTIQHYEEAASASALRTALEALADTFRAMPFAYLIGPSLSVRVRILGADAEEVAPGVGTFGYLNIKYRSCAA